MFLFSVLCTIWIIYYKSKHQKKIFFFINLIISKSIVFLKGKKNSVSIWIEFKINAASDTNKKVSLDIFIKSDVFICVYIGIDSGPSNFIYESDIYTFSMNWSIKLNNFYLLLWWNSKKQKPASIISIDHLSLIFRFLFLFFHLLFVIALNWRNHWIVLLTMGKFCI